MDWRCTHALFNCAIRQGVFLAMSTDIYCTERSSQDRQEQNIQLPTRTSDFLSFVSRLSEPLGFTAKIRDMVLNPALYGLYLGFFQLRKTALYADTVRLPSRISCGTITLNEKINETHLRFGPLQQTWIGSGLFPVGLLHFVSVTSRIPLGLQQRNRKKNNQKLVTYLNGQCPKIICLWFFRKSSIVFPQASGNSIRVISNFFKNLRRYLQVKVHHWYQQHKRQICHRC
jgi:hypothetical protein